MSEISKGRTGKSKTRKGKTRKEKLGMKQMEDKKSPPSSHTTNKSWWLRAAILSTIIGGIAGGFGLWAGSATFIIVLVAVFGALSILLVATISRSIISWRVGIWSIAIIITCIFIYTIEPLSYKADTLEQFRFDSDSTSVNNGVRYDQCSLLSIGNATSNSVLLWFGCTSPQLVKMHEELPENIIMEYGNCDEVQAFAPSLLNNNIPDYLIEFPFQIDGIGRICKKRLYISNGNVTGSEDIPLNTLAAGHFQGRNNTLIVEWSDAPSLNEFSLYGYNLFKKVAFDRMSIYWDIDDQWMRESGLENNMPSSFNIELNIPARYVTEDIMGKYQISHETHGLNADYVTLKTDLVKDRILHLVLVDNTKHKIKLVFSALFGVFALALFIDTILGLQRRSVSK